MDNLLNRRAMAISMVIGLTMMALVGFAVLADVEPPLTAPTIAITDTYGTADDQKAYVGDTFSFAVDAYGAPNNNSNISGEVTIGALAPIPLVWNLVTNLTWDASYVADTVGTFAVNVSLWDINAPANMISDLTYTIEVWEPVSLDATYVLPTFTEDTETHWNLSAAFLPEKDLSGAGLTFGTDLFPTGWTFTPMMDGVYTHWVVTPPAGWSGWQLINVSAEDANGEGTYNIFNLTVGPVNDGPSLDYLYVDGVEYYPEWYNQTTEWNGTNATAWRMINVVNLTIDEDTVLTFDVNATDVDDTELTYEVMFEDTSAPLTIEVATVIVNTTTNETAEIPNSFVVTPEADLNGWFIGTVNVSDAAGLYDMFWFQVEVASVNDAPTGTVTAPTALVTDLKTGENFTFTADVADIDGDTLTVTWLVDGVETFFGADVEFNWTVAAIYNVTCSVSDGVVDVPLGTYWHFNVTLAVIPNTAPEIISVTVTPDVDDFSGLVDWIANREVEEGTGLDLMCLATDADGDTLTYTWTHDQDTTWSMTGASVVVAADDLEAGKTYVFTCTVSDGEATDSMSAAGVKIVEEEEPADINWMACLIPIIIIAIIVIVIVVVLILVLKGKKKEEVPPAPEGEVPPEGAEAPVEGEVPAEGAPVEGEVPAEGAPAPEAPAPEAPAPEAPQAPQ